MPIKDYINQKTIELLAPFCPEILRISGVVPLFGFFFSKDLMRTDIPLVGTKQSSARGVRGNAPYTFFKTTVSFHKPLRDFYNLIADFLEVNRDKIDRVTCDEGSGLIVRFVSGFSEHKKIIKRVNFLRTAKNIDCYYDIKGNSRLFTVSRKSFQAFSELLCAWTYSSTFFA